MNKLDIFNSFTAEEIEICSLHFCDGFSYREIKNLLKITIYRVECTINKLRSVLRKNELKDLKHLNWNLGLKKRPREIPYLPEFFDSYFKEDGDIKNIKGRDPLFKSFE
jgi:hypothetical protein